MASAGLSCADTNCGGPTSDWPRCNSGDDSAPGGDPTNEPPRENGSGGKPSGGGKDDGESSNPIKPGTSTPPSLMDGGSVSTGGKDAGSPSKADDGGVDDGGVPDGGVPDAAAADAGTPPLDCIFGSSDVDAGTCLGLPCVLPPSELLKLLCGTGNCLGVCTAPTP